MALVFSRLGNSTIELGDNFCPIVSMSSIEFKQLVILSPSEFSRSMPGDSKGKKWKVQINCIILEDASVAIKTLHAILLISDHLSWSRMISLCWGDKQTLRSRWLNTAKVYFLLMQLVRGTLQSCCPVFFLVVLPSQHLKPPRINKAEKKKTRSFQDPCHFCSLHCQDLVTWPCQPARGREVSS